MKRKRQESYNSVPTSFPVPVEKKPESPFSTTEPWLIGHLVKVKREGGTWSVAEASVVPALGLEAADMVHVTGWRTHQYDLWEPFVSNPPPRSEWPEGWPYETKKRAWWNPMRFFRGETYIEPRSWAWCRVEVDIVVHASLVTIEGERHAFMALRREDP